MFFFVVFWWETNEKKKKIIKKDLSEADLMIIDKTIKKDSPVPVLG